jgi:hypothetical protein
MTHNPCAHFLLLAVAGLGFAVSVGCERRGSLTQEAAQDSINRWAISQFSANENSVKIVGGVRELPNENAATVELKFDTFNYTLSNSPDR